MASNQDIAGRLRAALADRYRIEREIGSGGRPEGGSEGLEA